MRICVYLRHISCGMVVLLLASGCGVDNSDTPPRNDIPAEAARWLIEAQEARRGGDFHVGLALVDSALDVSPRLADAHFLRGQLYADLHRYEASTEAYQEAIMIDPSYRGARQNAGLNYFRAGQLRDAIEYVGEEMEQYPSSNGYLHLGRIYARLGEADSAMWAYTRSLELDAENASAHMWLGQLYEQKGDLDRALDHGRTGIALAPDNLNYKYIVGAQLLRSGRPEEAQELLGDAAAGMPWHQGAQYNYAQSLLRNGERDRAERYLARADSAQQLQQAINEAKAAADRNPGDVSAWTHLADLHRQVGLFDDAVESYQVAVALEPQNLGMHANLATLYLQAGQSDRGIDRLQHILRIDPSLADVWFNLGIAYADAGRMTEARRAWEQTLALQPFHPQAADYLRTAERR